MLRLSRGARPVGRSFLLVLYEWTQRTTPRNYNAAVYRLKRLGGERVDDDTSTSNGITTETWKIAIAGRSEQELRNALRKAGFTRHIYYNAGARVFHAAKQLGIDRKQAERVYRENRKLFEHRHMRTIVRWRMEAKALAASDQINDPHSVGARYLKREAGLGFSKPNHLLRELRRRLACLQSDLAEYHATFFALRCPARYVASVRERTIRDKWEMRNLQRKIQILASKE